jgi:hypothetical protein
MILFPALAAAIALACAVITGRDALRRPRPERAIWTLAFLVFAIAAGAEVLGQALGWTATLARVYYLAGAVLVVGILALGELYLLVPSRLPAVTPGISMLVGAVAVTAVWAAPIDSSRLQLEGWHAIARGPFLVALAATINAGGTFVLVSGALYSAWRTRTGRASTRRAAGCTLIAIGTLAVAAGGTLTRFGRPEYLYLAMAAGIALIFAGIVLTRSRARGHLVENAGASAPLLGEGVGRMLTNEGDPRPVVAAPELASAGVRFVARALLERDPEGIADLCRQWGATAVTRDALTRGEARRVWTLRLALPETAQDRLDALPVATRAQLAELFEDVWSHDDMGSGERALAVLTPPLSILPVRSGVETREHEHV